MRRLPALSPAALLLSAGLLLSLAATLQSQEAPAVVPGDRVRLQIVTSPPSTSGGATHVGTIERVGADTVWFRPERLDSDVAIAWAQVSTIDLSTGYLERASAMRRGAAIGVGIGLIVAAIDFAARGGSCGNMRDPQCFLTARGVGLVVSGGVVGGLLGAAAGGEQWRRVYPVAVALSLPRPGASRAGVALAVQVR